MTYSIAARDPAIGVLGVAVQSHWFSVGPIVPWCEAGTGVVATQAFADPGYGPQVLDLLRAGRPAPAALSALTSIDEQADRRQVAVVDTAGRVAVHTGARCIPESGHRTGAEVSVQANMMRNDTVPDAMLEAYSASDADLAGRMMAALEAAEAAGGDVRGRQSAAMVIVASRGTGRPWVDRLVDLRVDDHDDPLGELSRLLTLHRAYDRMNRADEHLTGGDTAAASGEYRAARTEADITEAAFWHGVMLAEAGDIDGARDVLEHAFAEHDGWELLLRRLPAVDLLPEEVVRRIVGEA